MSKKSKKDSDSDPIVIPLGESNLITWISQEDFEIANWGWKAKSAGKKARPAWYAISSFKLGGTYSDIYLHNLIWERAMGHEVPQGFLIDHINGDKLDNRRSNLRLATRTQNEANKKKRRSATTSKYKGVTKINDGRKKCWRCTITTDGKLRTVGTYYDEIEAAKAYNKEALEAWGEFAYINKIDEKENEDNR